MTLLYAYLVLAGLWYYLILMLFVYTPYPAEAKNLRYPLFHAVIALVAAGWPVSAAMIMIKARNKPLYNKLLGKA